MHLYSIVPGWCALTWGLVIYILLAVSQSGLQGTATPSKRSQGWSRILSWKSDQCTPYTPPHGNDKVVVGPLPESVRPYFDGDAATESTSELSTPAQLMWKKLAMTFLPKRSARIKSLSWYSRVKARYNAVKDLIVAGSNCALGPLDVLTVYWSALAVPEYAHYQLPALDQEHKQLLEHTVQIPQGISHTSDNALEQGDPQGNVWRPWDTLTVWELAQYHPVLLAIVQGQLPLFEQVWTKVKSEKFSLYDYIQPHPASKATFVYLYLLLLQVAVICDRQRIVEKLLQPVVLLDAAKKHSIDLYVAGLAVKYSAYTVQEYFEQGHDEMWHLFDTLVAHHRQEQDVELSTDIMMAELEKHIRQYDLELSLVSPLKVHIPVQVVRD